MENNFQKYVIGNRISLSQYKKIMLKPSYDVKEIIDKTKDDVQ